MTHLKPYITALLKTWQFWCIVLLVATTYLFLRFTEPKTEKISNKPIDTTDVLFKIADLSLDRLGYIIDQQKILDSLRFNNSPYYHEYFMKVSAKEQEMTDKVIELKNQIGEHNLDYLHSRADTVYWLAGGNISKAEGHK